MCYKKKNGHRLHQPYEKHKINAMQWKSCQDIGILHKVKVSNLIPKVKFNTR